MVKSAPPVSEVRLDVHSWAQKYQPYDISLNLEASEFIGPHPILRTYGEDYDIVQFFLGSMPRQVWMLIQQDEAVVIVPAELPYFRAIGFLITDVDFDSEVVGLG